MEQRNSGSRAQSLSGVGRPGNDGIGAGGLESYATGRERSEGGGTQGYVPFRRDASPWL